MIPDGRRCGLRLGFYTDYSPAIVRFASETGFRSMQLSGPVVSIALAPDGQHALLGGVDGNIR